MKRVMFAVLLVFCWIDIGFADIMSDTRMKQYAMENATIGDSDLQLDMDEVLDALNSGNRTRRRAWQSSNPADLLPVKGTTWNFNYTVGSTPYTDTITIGTDVNYSSDGSAMLQCWNQFGVPGGVLYGEMVTGGIGFNLVILGDILTDFYSFRCYGNTASGKHVFKVNSTGEYSRQYSLSGYKLSGPSTPVEPACTGLPYQSTHNNIQWDCRGNDTNYCIDILDQYGNMLHRAADCGEGLHSFSPENLYLSPGTYQWIIWSESGYGGTGFEGEFQVYGEDNQSYRSTYDLVQWGYRGSDQTYCIDICDDNWNVFDGLRAVECGDGLHSWSPKTFVRELIGNDLAPGSRFKWRVWSPSGYGGSGFEGEVVVP